jgi:Predicted transcriptional regulators
MSKLKVEYVKKEDLKTYVNNAKKHSAEQVEAIKKSIKKFGFNDPIAVWKDNVIIEGHGRLLAVMEMDDIKEVPIIRLDDLTDKERKAYTIAHNKLTMNTGFDNDMLGEELKSIMDEIDMTDFGFGDFELSVLTEDFEPTPYDDKEIEEYSTNEDKFLAKKRVIITFTDEDAQKLAKMLNLEEIDKVVYDFKELMLKENI